MKKWINLSHTVKSVVMVATDLYTVKIAFVPS